MRARAAGEPSLRACRGRGHCPFDCLSAVQLICTMYHGIVGLRCSTPMKEALFRSNATQQHMHGMGHRLEQRCKRTLISLEWDAYAYPEHMGKG